ncbi:oligosaccharyl transferase beta subunit [Infundibulicybe gibba]|nr:oligosaccharyl transferase beta subunit [Infundibulicybe gibba]
MLSFRTFFLLSTSVLASVYAKSSTGNSVLVVVEPARQDDYSIFFNGLKDSGYDLTFRAPRAETPVIIEHDVPAFAHVIMLSPDSKSYAKDITPQSLVGLLSSNTNLLIALSPKQTPLTSLAQEFSLILPPPGTPLMSYFPQRDDPATVVPVNVSPAPMLSANSASVWFSGTPHALGNNPLLVPILRAPPESFAADSAGDSGATALVDSAEKGGEGLWAGSQMGLATGFQAHGGARVAWIGGVDIFSDKFAQKELPGGAKSGNAQFSRDLAAWTFQESLVLRIDETSHHIVNSTLSKEHYTTNDEITFTAKISSYTPTTGKWVPYSKIQDLQLEFTMLDPHIRTALRPVLGAPGKYSATFRAPDRHGVFKFIINYKRKGWTHLHSSTTVPVVPPRHDGYPRFLSAAWPYYIGAISTSVAFFLFSALWLAGDIREAKKAKKTQ